MNKNVTQVIDSVSASQLMKALSTLQHLSQRQGQLQVSFCKYEISQNKKNVVVQPKNIDFETYMAGQQQKASSYSKSPIPKQKSPLKQNQQNSTAFKLSNVSNMKSRSHSPFQKKSSRTDSRISKYYKPSIKFSQKENKKQEEATKKNAKYPSFQSKRILEQKQRSGISYIPIQYRAEELLKQKQLKIAKMQKQKEISKIMEEKECTFRPNILKNYKKLIQVQNEHNVKKVTQDQIKRFNQCFIDQQYLCTPTQPFGKEFQNNFQQQKFPKKSNQVNQNNETKGVIKKYKNQKFNCLLDFIH